MPDIEVGGKALISQSGTANPVIKSNVNFTGVIDSTATGTFSGTFSGALTGATGNWGLKLLQTEIISTAVSHKDIGSSSLFSSTYDTYKIIFTDLGLASDNSIYVLFKLGSATDFNTDPKYDYVGRSIGNNSTSLNAGKSDGQHFIKINTYDIWGDNNADNRMGASGEITVPNPTQTGRSRLIYGNMVYLSSSGYLVETTYVGGHGYQGGTSTYQNPITGIRIKGASQNFTRGTIRLYGVVNA